MSRVVLGEVWVESENILEPFKDEDYCESQSCKATGDNYNAVLFVHDYFWRR